MDHPVLHESEAVGKNRLEGRLRQSNCTTEFYLLRLVSCTRDR